MPRQGFFCSNFYGDQCRSTRIASVWRACASLVGPRGRIQIIAPAESGSLSWIDHYARLHGGRVLDVGCGGGILCESMAQLGARVKGIDLCAESLSAAELHRLETGV